MVNEIITITSKTKQKSQHLQEGEIVQNYWKENGPMFSFNYYTHQYNFSKKLAFEQFGLGNQKEKRNSK